MLSWSFCFVKLPAEHTDGAVNGFSAEPADAKVPHRLFEQQVADVAWVIVKQRGFAGVEVVVKQPSSECWTVCRTDDWMRKSGNRKPVTTEARWDRHPALRRGNPIIMIQPIDRGIPVPPIKSECQRIWEEVIHGVIFSIACLTSESTSLFCSITA